MHPLAVIAPRMLCPKCGRRLLKVLGTPSERTTALVLLVEPALYIGLAILGLAIGAAAVYHFVLVLAVAIVVASPLVLLWILMFKAKRDAKRFTYECAACARIFKYEDVRRGAFWHA
jgi:Flp pilus assembly protein TadB